MHRTPERKHLRPALRAALTTLLLLATSPLWAHPAKGTPAPSLDGLTLLQAPAGAKADRPTLKGKIVVLEFWATWCSPCVASLPHLNQLVASLDPAKFQFLSIDDEDLKSVQNFLAKKKMSGWVGLDASGAVFHRYGVASRPTTVIIDGSGKVAAVTELDSVTSADLQAVALGKPVAFKPALEITESSAPSVPSAGRPLFSVSVTRAPADAKMSRVNHPPTGTDLLGEDAGSLLTDVFPVFAKPYVLNAPLPEGRYDLRIASADVPQPVNDAIVQQAVLAALHLQVQPRTLTRPAYLLRATDAAKKLLSPSASSHAVKRGTWDGKFLLMNGTLDDLAYVLATALENPVLNQTGIDGAYDARFEVPGLHAAALQATESQATSSQPTESQPAGRSQIALASLNAVLRQTLGLELVPGTQTLPITVLELSKEAETKPPASNTTQGARQ